jgi:hypothetical protein
VKQKPISLPVTYGCHNTAVSAVVQIAIRGKAAAKKSYTVCTLGDDSAVMLRDKYQTKERTRAMSNQPAGLAKVMKKGKDGKAYWYRVGAMWPTKNAKVHRLQLDAVPVDGVLFLTEYEPKDDGETAPDGIESETPF